MNEALVLKNNLKEVRTQKGMSQADLANGTVQPDSKAGADTLHCA